MIYRKTRSNKPQRAAVKELLRPIRTVAVPQFVETVVGEYANHFFFSGAFTCILIAQQPNPNSPASVLMLGRKLFEPCIDVIGNQLREAGRSQATHLLTPYSNNRMVRDFGTASQAC